jgi:hypothetical protein
VGKIRKIYGKRETQQIKRPRTSDSRTVADPMLIANMLAEKFFKTSSSRHYPEFFRRRKKEEEKKDVTFTIKKNTTAYLRKKYVAVQRQWFIA